MSRNQPVDGAGFLVGVATGALVGAGLALIFAPKSGTALREDLGASMSNVRDAVSERYRDLAGRAGVELDNLQERVDRVAESVESGARELIDSATQQATRMSGRSGRG